jgi:hypothetical protein
LQLDYDKFLAKSIILFLVMYKNNVGNKKIFILLACLIFFCVGLPVSQALGSTKDSEKDELGRYCLRIAARNILVKYGRAEPLTEEQLDTYHDRCDDLNNKKYTPNAETQRLRNEYEKTEEDNRYLQRDQYCSIYGFGKYNPSTRQCNSR